MSGRSGERLSTAARHLVFDWNLRLTRGLPEAVARDRIAQIESDLWEHAAAHRARGRGDASLAGAVLSRFLRGLPADLGWRRDRIGSGLRLRPGGDGPLKEETMSKRKTESPAKPWVHLQAEKPFDQTNGLVDFDIPVEEESDRDMKLRLLERGAAANMVNVGFGGGSF